MVSIWNQLWTLKLEWELQDGSLLISDRKENAHLGIKGKGQNIILHGNIIL